jgi:FAD/FMN-containing dehydrogenase
MPRSGWAAHGGRSQHHLKHEAFVHTLSQVSHRFFERTGVSKQEWKDLSRELVGKLLLPDTCDYCNHRVSNPRFDFHPQAIVCCATPEDISLSLALARAHPDLKVTCRSGGHSTAGYSVNNGLVLDLSAISYAAVDPAAMTVRTGAGTNFKLFDSVLDSYGLHVPSGGCGDVCVGGYMQGGGYGFTSRQFGINCDRVRAFTMVLPDGKLVTADEKNYPDLFWAVRGGTGNQFGVLVDVTYELVALRYVAACALYWSLDSAPKILEALQKGYMQSGVTPDFGYQVMITTLDKKPRMLLCGMYPGTEDEIKKLIKPLTALAKPDKLDTYHDTYNKLNANMVDNLLPGPGTPGTLELKQCGYIAAPLGVDGWGAICDYMNKVAADANPYNMAYLEVYGGAINALPPQSNAFIHRRVDCNFAVDAFYNPDWEWEKSKTQEQAQQWMDNLWKLVGPHTNGHVYQDYPDASYTDYRWQYWGDAFPTLLKVKQRYDPTGLFDYGQPITPYPAGPGIRRSTHPALF